MGVKVGPKVAKDGLVFALDAAVSRSYSGSGITVNGLVGGIGGTLVNGVGFTSTDGGYFSFDGTNDYIAYSRNNIYDIGSSDFTVIYWINTTTKSRYNAVIDLNDAGGKIIIATQITTGYSWTWFTSSYNIVGTIDMCDGTWHLAAISRIGSTLTHYVDGRVSVSTNVGSHSVPSNDFLSIGKLWQTGDQGLIKLSDVKIYKNKGLTQQEILQNYNATKRRYGL